MRRTIPGAGRIALHGFHDMSTHPEEDHLVRSLPPLHTLIATAAISTACGPQAPVPEDSDATTSPACSTDAACDDADPCNGAERCLTDGRCESGEPVRCDAEEETCVVRDEAPSCEILCPIPTAPVLERIRPDDVLTFRGAPRVETALLDADQPIADALWTENATVDLSPRRGPVRVLARAIDDTCSADDLFDHVYTVVDAFPGPAGTDGSIAISIEDDRIVGWAHAIHDSQRGDAVDDAWFQPEQAIGPAQGTSTDIVSLGRAGSVTLTFDRAITDGPGPDLAVFENAFTDTFLEFARVEVSSNGSTFAAFDSSFHGAPSVGSFEDSDPRDVAGLAGLYRQGFGTPFDLGLLRHHPAVQRGVLNLDAITYVRIVDVVGDGTEHDTFGRPIGDPYPTTGSTGFDLDGVALLRDGGP